MSILAKISNLFRDWSRSLNYEKGLSFECIKREGSLKDTHRNTQNAALSVDLFLNIFYLNNETLFYNVTDPIPGL